MRTTNTNGMRNASGAVMGDLMWVLAYTALAVVLAVLIGAAIVGGSDDWDDRFR